MIFKNVIIGAGFAGAVLAREIVENKNEDVLIVERRNHIAGNAYDFYNENDILVHKYGPHIFHTNSKEVWEWLSRFTKWHLYQHRVLSYVDGMLVPMPISIETVNQLYNLNLNSDEIEKWLLEHSIDIKFIENSKDVILSKAGEDIYNKFFKNYTFKQWGVYPDKLDKSVISRIPVRNNRDTRYFSDKYQGIPKLGYTKMFENILDHKKIHIMLNTDWNYIQNHVKYNKLFYTGMIDEFYNYKFGKLGYRSIKFEYDTFYDREFYQPVGTVNYPNDYDFTRITEYKYLTGQSINCTTIVKEYSQATGEPFYPVPNEENKKIYNMYYENAKHDKDIIFLGRLGEYKYYNMDQIVARVLKGAF